ncbi:hypothetical protein C3B55_00501 [Candidatus Pseudomonas adelgestsugas]|uniref:Uncharacterized protein n=1 Tax=Candidatus Pseudomonas adelgestsugas TaxID=1302376 RepID=A0ABX5R862_9PSED|nr:hypothetical protein C3B55_00501 [Candidatus Pseudomonas adelgestsugas]
MNNDNATFSHKINKKYSGIDYYNDTRQQYAFCLLFMQIDTALYLHRLVVNMQHSLTLFNFKVAWFIHPDT